MDAAVAAVSLAPLDYTIGNRLCLFFAGYAVVGISTGVYVATGYPRMPIDRLMLSLSRSLRLDLKYARLIIEGTGFLVMLFVHGPLGIGTVIMTLTMGFIVSISRKAAAEKLKL